MLIGVSSLSKVNIVLSTSSRTANSVECCFLKPDEHRIFYHDQNSYTFDCK